VLAARAHGGRLPRIRRHAADILLGVDRRIGAAVSSSVAAHHRRRLARLGQAGTLAAERSDWSPGEPPPRPGCSLVVLIDGEEAATHMLADLAAASSHVHLAGWHFSPDFALVRGTKPLVLRNLLAELSERVEVRVLAWGGSPLPLFRPTRASVRKGMDELCRGTRVRYALDTRERPMHCHHEKTIEIDGRVAYVGGIDLSLEGGDRFDSHDHIARAKLGWHDVAARLEGPAVADVAAHFRMRWREVTSERLEPGPTPQASGRHTVQVVRTVPERVYSAVPRGEFRILDAYLRALRSSRSLVYLENQFLWSPEIAEVLRKKLRRPSSDDFRLVLLLPAKPNTGADDTRGMLSELIEADGGAGRLLACTVHARHGSLSDPVYVHAKVGIVDDAWLTIGSANLNEHSLFNDTEMNVVCRDADVVRETRLRLWAEHLELDPADLAAPPSEIVDRFWKPISREQLARRKAGLPLTHRLVELPGLSSRTERLLGPLQGLLVDG
jgi:phosphatidylserine/phosphatidylglycerophosphate/cardiolipin synthase-like enzyme